MPPKAAKPAAPDNNEQEETVEEPLIAAEDCVGSDARWRVPFAGLLADKPELHDELHTRQEWQELLEAYLRSERI